MSTTPRYATLHQVSQETDTPSSFNPDTSLGGAHWSHLNDVAGIPNSQFADVQLEPQGDADSDDKSYHLIASHFGFDVRDADANSDEIPERAEIDGIRVEISAMASEVGHAVLYIVQLTKDGSERISANKGDTVNFLPIETPKTFQYGGSDKKWSVPWTAEEIRGTGFGVIIQAWNIISGRAVTASVDWNRIHVTWHE